MKRLKQREEKILKINVKDAVFLAKVDGRDINGNALWELIFVHKEMNIRAYKCQAYPFEVREKCQKLYEEIVGDN